MFKLIKNYFNSNTQSEEQIEEDTENGQPLLSINFMLTTEGILFIDLENITRKIEANELAAAINYISSYKGQLDVLEIIQTNLLDSDQEELYNDFVKHFAELKINEASLLNERKEEDSTPYINPSEMLP